jgi:hypothetical protein
MFEQLERNTRKLSSAAEIANLLVQAASQSESELIDLNTSQLEIGKMSTGEDTPEYSNPDYGAMKRSEGSKSGNNYDYKLEGDFYEGWKIDFEATSLIWDSTDSKTSKLTSPPFGTKDVFGIAPFNYNQAGEEISSDFQEIFMEEFLNGL